MCSFFFFNFFFFFFSFRGGKRGTTNILEGKSEDNIKSGFRKDYRQVRGSFSAVKMLSEDVETLLSP